MNLYEAIKNPLDEEKFLEKILEKYSASESSVYRTIVRESNMNKKELKENKEKFVKHMLIPAIQEYMDQLKSMNSDERKRYNKIVKRSLEASKDVSDDEYYKIKRSSFYPIEKYAEMFEKYSAEDLFQNYNDMDKKYQKYIDRMMNSKGKTKEEVLKESNLTSEELELIETYRKLSEQFDAGKGIMGFHVNGRRLGRNPKLDKDEMKLYVNAGADTYEFARKFWEKCDEEKLNFYFKVANPLSYEGNRLDKMCIFLPTDKAAKYIEILKKVREENPDLNYQEPPALVGKVDKWIGVGADKGVNENRKSYNQIRSDILEDSIEKVFKGIKRSDVSKYAKAHPEKIKELRSAVEKGMSEQGIAKENFAIDKGLVKVFKNIKLGAEKKLDTVKEKAASAGKKVKETAKNVSEKAKTAGSKAKETAKAAGSKAKETAKTAGSKVASTAKTAASKVKETVKKEKAGESKAKETAKKEQPKAEETKTKVSEKEVNKESTKSKEITLKQNLKNLKTMLKVMTNDYAHGKYNSDENEAKLQKLLHELYEQKSKIMGTKETLLEKRMGERQLDNIVSDVIRAAQTMVLHHRTNDVPNSVRENMKMTLEELNSYFKESLEKEDRTKRVSAVVDKVMANKKMAKAKSSSDKSKKSEKNTNKSTTRSKSSRQDKGLDR